MSEEQRLLKTIIWLLDMWDRPPAVPGFLAKKVGEDLQKAREVIGEPDSPSWSCYAKEKAIVKEQDDAG